MTKIDYITHEKSGVNQISLTPHPLTTKSRFGLVDGVLILGFMIAFVSLVFLLAK